MWGSFPGSWGGSSGGGPSVRPGVLQGHRDCLCLWEGLKSLHGPEVVREGRRERAPAMCSVYMRSLPLKKTLSMPATCSCLAHIDPFILHLLPLSSPPPSLRSPGVHGTLCTPLLSDHSLFSRSLLVTLL